MVCAISLITVPIQRELCVEGKFALLPDQFRELKQPSRQSTAPTPWIFQGRSMAPTRWRTWLYEPSREPICIGRLADIGTTRQVRFRTANPMRIHHFGIGGNINRAFLANWEIVMHRRALLAVPAILTARRAASQGRWPNRPVTMIVPWAPAGSNDITARLMAGQFEARFGQPFIVENRPGGGGSIGMGLVMRARPDGHTLLASSASNHVFHPLISGEVNYDVREVFHGMAMWVDVRSWMGLFAPRGTPAPIIQSMSEASRLALEAQQVLSRLRTLGSETIWMDATTTDRFAGEEYARWGPIIRQAGVKID